MTSPSATYKLTTKEEFFAALGRLNVHPRAERERTFWETPGRQVLGISTPGYLCVGPKTYALARAA